jgi:hypothetical protein
LFSTRCGVIETSMMKMGEIRRLIIVRRDARGVYGQLRRAFGHDHRTVIVYDRRIGSSRDRLAEAPDQPDRRSANEADILDARGFYSVRIRPPRVVRPARSGMGIAS